MNTTFDSDRNGGGMCQVTTRDGKVEYLDGIERSIAGLYEAVLKPNLKAPESSLTVSQMDWHQRLGHASESTMKILFLLCVGSTYKTKRVCLTVNLSNSRSPPDPLDPCVYSLQTLECLLI